MEERRVAQVIVSQRMVKYLFTPSPLVEVTKGLPADAVYLGATIDIERLTVRLFFSSPAFDVVPGGQIPPTVEVEYRTRE